MKIKKICLGAIALALVLWGCWSVAYQRGYSQGACDEFACWKQEPATTKATVLVGKRDPWMYPGGKKVPPAVLHSRDLNVNNIPDNPLP
jgi:hypothetical protein